MSAAGGEALPGAWGSFRFDPPAARGTSVAGPRSYVADGSRLTWFPGERIQRGCAVACDIEDRERTPSEEMSALVVERPGFHRFWVLGELAAKLLDVPMLELLRRYRRGSAPRFVRGTRALVLPAWAGHYTAGFACMPLSGSRRTSWQAARPDWGFPRVAVAGGAMATALTEEHRDG